MSGNRPGGGQSGAPAQKALNFLPSVERLLARLAPDRARVLLVVALGVVSVALTVLGPWILGKATDVIFDGVLGRGLPEGISKAAAVADARARGDAGTADLLSGAGVVPGQGVDFTALGQIVLVALGVYVVASLISWLQGYLLNDVVQHAVYTLRRDVEAELNRLPLTYFDARPRGEILSRVTNDLDNVGQSLQQTLSQLLTSVLTVVGVLVMMLVISPPLALVALVAVPLALGITVVVARRSQRQFVAQWARTGTLNAQIEEAFTGHELVKVFGRTRDEEARFEVENERLYDASFRAQFVSGLIQPLMLFVGNLSYVAIAEDTWLFGGTIRENIAYGRLDATEEQIVEAARATYVDRFVRSLPQGYDTVVDDDGESVSAGEKQLITIARAFLERPEVLILDEATSSVDTRTEVLVQRAMAALRSGRTSFVIAHRLSTIRDADLILVMEAGRIVEQGTHDELIARDGAYSRLNASQVLTGTQEEAAPV